MIMKVINNNQFSSSFRDNNGFVFEQNGIFYRQVNRSYQENYDFFISSGLYAQLINSNLLIAHEEIAANSHDINCYKILKPLQLNFITYPASWSFSMLKDAALLTLSIQVEALRHDMILKDASSYNVQFLNGKPIFIDTLSFEKLKDNTKWLGFGQFCRHFLAPLSLSSYTDINLINLMSLYIDGIPLDLAVKLLPIKAKFNLGLCLHLFIHSKLILENQTKKSKLFKTHFKKSDLFNQADSLFDTIQSLHISKQQTEWDSYYEKDVSDKYFEHKEKIINDFLILIKTDFLLDLGANNGTFSMIAAKNCTQVFAFDVDPIAIEKLYKRIKREDIRNIIPLIIDIANPEPAIGWINEERKSILQRIKVDTIMVLALIHHLRISAGIPVQKLAKFLSDNCQNLIIEFIPKSDPKVQFLLRNREDVFDDYEELNFLTVFQEYFKILSQKKIETTNRILFLMKKNDFS